MNWENLEPNNEYIKSLKKDIKDMEKQRKKQEPWDYVFIVMMILALLAFIIKTC